jgi:tight adherence protein B
MRLPPLPLLLTGAALLAVCPGTMLLLARIDAAARTAARTQAVLGPYRPPENPRPALTGHLLQRLPLPAPHLLLARLFDIHKKWIDGYPLRPGVVLALALLAAAAAAWLIALVAPLPPWLPAWLSVPPLWVLFSRAVFRFFAKRRRNLLFQQFPDVLSMMVRALRVGQTVTEALRGVASNAPEPSTAVFARLVDRLAIGVPLNAALPELAEDGGLTEYRFFCTALLLQNRSGGSLTEALDTLAEVIRARVTLRRRAYAMSSEARTSAIVLAILPVVTFIGMIVLAPGYAHLLLADELGRRMLAGAVAMVLVGGALMNAMVRRLLR